MYDEIKYDVKFLHVRLIHTNKKDNFGYYGIAKYLLQRSKDMNLIEVGKLDTLEPSIDMKSLIIIESKKEKLRSYRKVYESRWFELFYILKRWILDIFCFSREL